MQQKHGVMYTGYIQTPDTVIRCGKFKTVIEAVADAKRVWAARRPCSVCEGAPGDVMVAGVYAVRNFGDCFVCYGAVADGVDLPDTHDRRDVNKIVCMDQKVGFDLQQFSETRKVSALDDNWERRHGESNRRATKKKGG